jgi:hypothetical protein
MDVLARLVVAMVGALAGAVIGAAVTYALLSGEEADAFSWLALGIVFCLPATVAGALLAGPLLGRRFQRVGPQARPGYAIAATLLVLVVGPLLAIDLAASADDDFVFEDLLCKKPGVLYASDAFDTETLEICLTTSHDLSKLNEVGWRFGPASGCPEASTYVGRERALPGSGRIDEPGFTATIRRARANGVLEDSEVCPGKSFKWTARRETSSPPGAGG